MLTEEQKEKIEYLSQYKYINTEIDRKVREIEDWKSKIYNVTGTLSDMPKSKNRTNTLEGGIARINEIETTINQDIDRLLEVKTCIENKINGLEDLKLRELMKCRYLDCKTWEEIAYKNGYTWQWAYRLHEKALDIISIS